MTADLARAALDAFDGHVCLIDQSGTILFVNHAWSNFARANAGEGAGNPGANYLTACSQASDRGDRSAKVILEGLHRILSGRLSGLEVEYPCHSPTEARWFLLVVRPWIEGSSERPRGAVLIHLDITKRRRSELDQAQMLEAVALPMGVSEDQGWLCASCGRHRRVDGHWTGTGSFVSGQHIRLRVTTCPNCVAPRS
jgi:hypothetical protein